MQNHGKTRALWGAIAAFGCAAGLGVTLSGCHREEQPHVKTAAEIQAQIDKVQNDPKMPPQIKEMVLGKLRGAKQTVERKADSGT